MKQIRRVFGDNFSLFLNKKKQKNKCCGYSLESPWCSEAILMGTQYYPQHMFLWRTIENYPLIIAKYPPYLVLSRSMAKTYEIECASSEQSDRLAQLQSLKSLHCNLLRVIFHVLQPFQTFDCTKLYHSG